MRAAGDETISGPITARPIFAGSGFELRAWLPTLTLGALLAYLVVLPLALLLVSSVKPTGFPVDPGFTLQNFVKAYGDASFLDLLGTTVGFAIGSTALALLLGIALAWLVERTDMPARRLVRVLIVLPMATPPLLLAIAWVILLSPRIGVLNQILRDVFSLDRAPFDIYSLGGMIFVQGLSLVPTTFLVLSPAFRNMDPNLEEAARVSGARFATMLRRVILPMLWPAILAAAAFMLIACFVVFDIPGTLGMPARIFVLSSRMYYLISDSPTGLPLYGEVSALAIFFLALLLMLGWGYQRMTKQAQRFVTISGKGYRVRPYRLGAWRWPVLAPIFLYFLLAVVAPLLALIWTSLMPYQAKVSWAALKLVTLANHYEFLQDDRVLLASANSLIIAVVSATIVAFLSVLTSWIVVRTRAPGRRVLDLLAFVPLAIPGTMIGVALIYVYLTLSGVFSIYGTIWIIAIGYITQYLSYGTRVANGVMLQLHPELEEAGRVSGAKSPRVLRRITLPLVSPALVAIWIWVAAHALRELSTALMLQGRDNPVVPTLLWDAWSGGEPNRAAAIGVWLIGAVAMLLIMWQLAARRSLDRE